jgi:HPt (histidine-containing phosphotransfer) domain-containing protein
MTTLPTQFDRSRLDHLLALVGPALAPDLLRQLDDDLSRCSQTIAQGTKAMDWGALRDASHVLISLAGSAGAEGLHGMARALNATAHDRNETTLAAVLPDLTQDLQALIAFIRNHGTTSESVA